MVKGRQPIYEDLYKRVTELEKVIYENKRSEKILREHARLYRLITETSIDLIFHMDLKGIFTYVSPSVQKLFGYSPEEVIGTNFADYFLSENLPKAFNIFLKVTEGERFEAIELVIKNKKGKSIPIEINIVPIITNKNVVGLQGIARNIWERKRSQDLLRKSKEKYKTLVEKIPHAIQEINTSGIITYANSAHHKLSGVQEGELIGRPIYDFIYNDSSREELKDYLDLLVKEQPIVQPWFGKAITQNKEVIDVKVDWEYKKDTNGHVIGFISVITDITSQKKNTLALQESEEKYRSILEAMIDGTYICTPDLKIEYMNSAMVKMVGQDATGKSCFNAIYNRQQKCPWCVHKRVMECESIQYELRNPKDNKYYYVVNSPIVQANRSVSKLTIFRDISEIKKAEMQLRQAQKLESVGILAGGIAHEFNNLLYIITGNTEFLLDNDRPEDQGFLNEIKKAVDRGVDLIKQLLAFSRKKEIDFQLLDLNLEIKKMKNMLERIIPKNIHIEIKLADDLFKIRADLLQIEQTIVNLCINARDAMPDGGQLTIETINAVVDGSLQQKHPEIQLGRCIILTITDTGVGMDPETLKHVFEPFYTTKDVGKGSGLGLSVIYGIVQGHKGAIHYSSEIGKGTMVRIYFPVENEKKDTFINIKTQRSFFQGKKTILIVDDEKSILKMTRHMLEPLGYTIVTAQSGESAFDIYAEMSNEIDLVLLDIGMPGMGGQKCLERLLSLNPHVKVLVSSGYSVNGSIQDSTEWGAMDFIVKPYTKRALVNKIQNILNAQPPV